MCTYKRAGGGQQWGGAGKSRSIAVTSGKVPPTKLPALPHLQHLPVQAQLVQQKHQALVEAVQATQHLQWGERGEMFPEFNKEQSI